MYKQILLLSVVLFTIAEARDQVYFRKGEGWTNSGLKYKINQQIEKMTQNQSVPLPGGWNKVNATGFLQSNNYVVQMAVQAVNQQYNTSAEGYTFQSVVMVNQQIVAGVNYALTLKFVNTEGSVELYEVVIYDCPWNSSNNQVVSVRPIQLPTPEASNSMKFGGWNPMNVTLFLQSNDNVAQLAVNTVNQKFNPQAEGYEFNKVVNVDNQIVAGMNYLVVLQYTNVDGDSKYYDVIVYSIPWQGTNQVVQCNQIKA